MWNKASRQETKILKAAADYPHIKNEQQRSGVQEGCRVIAVSSGKGGVGKTSLTVNLAISLAKLGKRVVIFDADLGLANAEVLLGITPPNTLFDWLYGDRRIEDIVVPGPFGVMLISGGSGFLEMANIDNGRRYKLIESLSYFDSVADFLIIDTGAGISKNVLGFVAAAGEVVIVVTPDPTSLTDAYSVIKVLARYKVHQEVMMVINRARDEKEAKMTLNRMENAISRFLQIKVHNIGWIAEDRAVSQAVKKQEPFCLYSPNSQPARSIMGIADYLITGRGEFEYGQGSFSGAGGFFRRLTRLFG